MVQNGVDLYKVQKLLRHTTSMMTQKYAHHSSESLRDGIEVLDRASTNLARCDENLIEENSTISSSN